MGAQNDPPVTEWPLARPRNWTARVNRPETDAELAELRTSVQRGRPLGSEAWQKRTAKRLGLQHTFRPRGRPPKRAGRAKARKQEAVHR